MKILCAGLPLKLRARLKGELEGAAFDSVNSEENLLKSLQSNSYQSLILEQRLLTRPPLQVLAEICAHFHGLVIFIFDQHLPAAQLKEMVRSYHVGSLLQHPAQAYDLIKTLTLELGLRIKPAGKPGRAPEEPSLEGVWTQSQPVVEEWLQRIQATLQPTASLAEDVLAEARRAAHFLNSNFGSFGLAKGSLLAREGERLLQMALEGHPLQRDRLGKVLEALRELLRNSQSLAAKTRRLVILVSDDSEFCSQLEMEASLLQWDLEVCQDLGELTEKLAHPRARVVVVEANSAASKRNPEALQELLRDPYPTVVLTESSQLPAATSSTHWITKPASAYRVMMTVWRSQLSPALDNPPLILVLDDDRICLEVIKRTLTDVDFAVEVLHSPLDFWDILEKVRPDLVILDIDLPNLSGIELCRALRLDDRYANIPVMMISGYADSQTVQRAFEAGADDFMAKPVVPPELRARVSNRLERSRQRQLPSRTADYAGRTYTRLDQLMLRSLREEIPMCLSLVALPSQSQIRLPLSQLLRARMRGEDLIKLIGENQILVAVLSADHEQVQRRLLEILAGHGEFGLAMVTFPDDGDDLEALIQLARQQLQPQTVPA